MSKDYRLPDEMTNTLLRDVIDKCTYIHCRAILESYIHDLLDAQIDYLLSKVRTDEGLKEEIGRAQLFTKEELDTIRESAYDFEQAYRLREVELQRELITKHILNLFQLRALSLQEESRKEGMKATAHFFKDRLKKDINNWNNGSITYGELDQLLQGKIPQTLQKEELK